MMFGELLRDNKEAIVKRWLGDVLAMYPEDSSVVLGRRRNQFANPVGHSLRVGTLAVFEALLQEEDIEQIGRSLHEIIKIRAVQQFTASQAVGFIFLLKQAVRAELGESIQEAHVAAEWSELQDRIDRLVLVAFDIYAHCRQQLYDIRVGELKRQIPWAMEKMYQCGNSNQESARVDLTCEGSEA